MKIIFILFLNLFTFTTNARIGFWRSQSSRVIFETASQTIFQYNCSGTVTLRHKNASNVNTNVASTLTVNLEAISGITYYADVSCTMPITSVDIPTGSSTASFYFTSDNSGSTSISLNTVTYGQITQSQTIVTNPYIWTGACDNANWATGANWAGGNPPNSTQIALFTTCASNCSPNIAANISVGGIRALSSYTGTITQETTKTITIDNRGLTMFAGTFNASTTSDTITSAGSISILGGTFNANSSQIILSSNFNVNGGTFNHGTSLVDIRSRSTFTVSNEDFYNLKFNTPWYSSITINGTLNILGTFTAMNGGDCSMVGGTINLFGNMDVSNYGFNGVNQAKSTLIKIAGNTNQTISSSSSNALIPNFEIASTGGTVIFSGTLNFSNNFTHTSGTTDFSASTIVLLSRGNNTYTIPSSYIFNNLTINYDSTTATLNGTLIVNGTLTLGSGNYSTSSGGTIEARGDINMNTLGLSPYDATTTQIKINGTGDQTITATGTTAILHNLEINKASGTLNLVGRINIKGDYTYTAGNINAGTSTFAFVGTNYVTYTSNGNENFYDLLFEHDNTKTIAGKLVATRNLYGKGVNVYSNITGGSIEVGGDVILTNYGLATYSSSTTQIKMLGNSPTISGVGTNAYLPELILSPASGNVNISGFVGARVKTSITSGNALLSDSGTYFTTKALELNSRTLTKNSGSLVVNGSTIGDGSLFGGTVNP